MTFSELCLDIFDAVEHGNDFLTRNTQVMLRTPDGDIRLDMLTSRRDENNVTLSVNVVDWGNMRMDIVEQARARFDNVAEGPVAMDPDF